MQKPESHTTTTLPILLLCVALLTGCDRVLTNEEIYEQSKWCKDHGMKIFLDHENTFHENGITSVECIPNG